MKYMRSKNRIYKDIIPILVDVMEKENITTFVDAFCGGCSIIENIPQKYHRIANDNNKYLIAMLSHLTEKKDIYPRYIDKELYSKARDCFHGKNNSYDDDMVGWIGFMASYNGRFFDGGYSGHNVKIKNNKIRDYVTENINNTLEQVPLLKDIEWHYGDYRDLNIPEHSLVYCDIPYKGTKQYSTSKDFDYDAFYMWCRLMNRKGHRIFVSEYDMPKDFKCVWQKEITNAMHQTNTKKPIEKLYAL